MTVRADPSSPVIVGEGAEARLARIAAVATELGAKALAFEAHQERQRLAEARFFVACIGQFKRGKSTLLNALVEEPVLPVGVIPVTSVITILRHGDRPAAFVRFVTGATEQITLEDVATFVDERHNPENYRGVAAVEVVLPAAILGGGLCLVDTPGLGSVLAANTAATRAFVLHIDVGLIVVGPDPPISGAELDVVEEVAREADHLLVVLNKADQASLEQREAVVDFTKKALERRLGQSVESILEVSALERLEAKQPTRDWTALETHLQHLAGDVRQRLVDTAAARAVWRLGRRLLIEIDEQDGALGRPLVETEERAARLRAALADLDRSLHDLRFLFDAVEADLGRTFEQQRIQFLGEIQPQLRKALEDWIARRSGAVKGVSLHSGALEHARHMAERGVKDWRTSIEPQVEARYREATDRFVQLAQAHVMRLAADTGALPVDEAVDAGLHARRQFYFASLMHLTGGTPWTWLLDRFAPRSLRAKQVARRATAYLAHLVESNSHRVENDFRSRTRESRQWLERAIRACLTEALSTAERALSAASARQRMAEAEICDRLEYLRRLREEMMVLASSPLSPPD